MAAQLLQHPDPRPVQQRARNVTAEAYLDLADLGGVPVAQMPMDMHMMVEMATSPGSDPSLELDREMDVLEDVLTLAQEDIKVARLASGAGRSEAKDDVDEKHADGNAVRVHSVPASTAEPDFLNAADAMLAEGSTPVVSLLLFSALLAMVFFWCAPPLEVEKSHTRESHVFTAPFGAAAGMPPKWLTRKGQSPTTHDSARLASSAPSRLGSKWVEEEAAPQDHAPPLLWSMLGISSQTNRMTGLASYVGQRVGGGTSRIHIADEEQGVFDLGQ